MLRRNDSDSTVTTQPHHSALCPRQLLENSKKYTPGRVSDPPGVYFPLGVVKPLRVTYCQDVTEILVGVGEDMDPEWVNDDGRPAIDYLCSGCGQPADQRSQIGGAVVWAQCVKCNGIPVEDLDFIRSVNDFLVELEEEGELSTVWLRYPCGIIDYIWIGQPSDGQEAFQAVITQVQQGFYS